MSFAGGGGGVGGASEALAYFIRAYDMATPVFRAFGAEVNAVTKQVQASMAEMNRQLASQNKVVADSAATQKAALGEVSAAQAGAADAAITASDEQVAAAKAAAAASVEQAAAAKKAAEAQVAAAEESVAAMSRAGTSVGRTGRNLALALAGATAASLDFAAKFQSNTLRMETQAGASVKQLALLRQGLLQMGGQVGATPDQLATGMFHVVSAMNQVIPPAKRVSVELNIMRAAAEGSQIGQSNLEDTAYALSSAMNALHKSTGDAYKVMGVLNATVGSGDMTMQDLIDAFKSGLIPAANSFGVSITSVGAALAVMGDMGMRGALAGTRLRMALSLMAAPTKQAAGILETLGMSSHQALASTKAMSDALQKAGVHTTTLTQDLRKPDGIAVALADLDSHLKASGLSADAAGAAISRAFGGGRMGAAITLLAQNTDRLGLKFDYINRKSNQFGHDWALTQATFRIQVDKALAAVEALGIALGDKLMPYATMALHELEDMAHWLLRNQTALEALGGAIVVFSTVAIGAYFFSKLKGAIGLIKEFGLSMKGFGGWLFGMGPTPSAAGPATEISTAITDSSAKGAAAMGDAITTANTAAVTKIEDAILVSSSKAAITIGDAIQTAGLKTAGELRAASGLVTTGKSGVAGLLGQATGKIWGFMGSEVMVGTIRNPIAVTIAGTGFAGGAMNATQAAEERAAGIGPAAAVASAEEQQMAQMALFGSSAEQAAKATGSMEQQMALFDSQLAGLSLPGTLLKPGEQLSLGGLANRTAPELTAASTTDAALSGRLAALRTSASNTLGSLSTGLAGVGMTLKSGISMLGSNLLRGGMLAGIGTMISQAVGSLIKGSAGSWVSSLGTGASLGAGAGIVIPGIGPIIGAAVGTAVAGAIHSGILRAMGFGQSAGTQVSQPLAHPFGGTSPSTGGIPAPSSSVQARIAQLITDAAKQEFHPSQNAQDANLGPSIFGFHPFGAVAAGAEHLMANATGNTAFESPQKHPMTPGEQQKFNQDMFNAGKLAASSLESGWNKYRFESEPIMFRQLEGAIWKFPPQAQAAAAESAIKFSQTLEKNKRLPVGATQNLVDDIKARFPQLVQYLGDTAQSALQAWSMNFNLNRWESQLKGTLGHVGTEFAGVGFTIAHTSGTIQQKTQTAISQLKLIAASPLTSPAEQHAAKQAAQQLSSDLTNTWTAAAQTANARGHDLLTTITNYTTQAAQVAATNMNLSDAQKNLDSSTQNIIGTIQTQWGLMRGVTQTTASDISNNMVVAFTTLEQVAKTKTGAARTEALTNLKLLQTDGTTYIQTLQSQTVLNIGKMSSAIMHGSSAAATAGVQSFSYFSSQVHALMGAGVVSTTSGMATITRALVTGLQALGINIKPGDLAGGTVADLQSYYKWATTGAGGGSNAGHGHHAMGGRVPGLPGADNWTIMDPSGQPAAMVQGGELLIPNRQTEARVNAKLMRGAAAGLWDPTTLSGEVAGETVPHHAVSTNTRAWGGRVPKAGLGVGYSGTSGGVPHVSGGPAHVYTSPFGSAQVGWGRTDQGVDVSLPVGTPIGVIGDARVSGVIPNWYAGQPYIWYELLRGPDAGKFVYVAEQISGIPGIPATDPRATSSLQTEIGHYLHEGQRIGYYATSGTSIETGWSTASGETLAKATTGYAEGQVTPAGSSFDTFLTGLTHGKITGGMSIPTIKQPKWTGPGGVIGMAGQQVLKIYTSAANALLQSKAGVMGGAGVTGAPGTKGTWGQPGFTITGKVSTFGPPGEAAGQTASGVSDAVPGISLHIPGTHFSDPSNEHLMGHTFRVNIAGHTAVLPDIDVGPADWVGRAIDVTGAGAARMGINPSTFPTDSIGSATLVRAMGGRVGWGGAHAQGGIVSVDQPTLALFGEGGPETAIFIPAGGVTKTPEQLAHLGMAGDSSPSTSYSHGSGHTSTGKPTTTSGTTTTEIIGNKEVTTTYHTHTGPTGTSTYTTTTTRPVSYTTGFNPLTDRVETHTSAQWAQIHAAYSQQQHDAAAAKKKHDKWLAHHVTDLIQIGGLPAGYIELTRKLAKQEHLPLGGSFTPADIGKLSQDGQKRVLTALNQFMAKASLGQLMSLSRSMAHTISQPGHPEHKRYVEYHHLHKEAQKHSAEAEKLHHRVEEVLHHAKQWEAGAKQNRAAARQETGKAREELLRMAHQDHEKAMELTRKAHSDRNKWGEQAHKDHQEALQETRKANKIGAQISQSPAGQAAADIINAATKSIMAAFTTTQQKFSAILTTVGLLEKVPPGSTAHSLGLTNIQMKAMGLTRKEIRKLAGGDNSATGLESPAAYLEVIKLLTHKEIPADQRTVRLLDQEYRDALKVHNHALAKSLLGRIDKVTQAEIQASSDLQTAQTNLIEAKYQAAETAIGNMQSRSDIIGSIQGLAPGTSLKSLGLNSRILKSLGFSPKMIKELPSLEGSSFGYIQELEQQQGGKLTATQINRFKSGIGVQNEILARMRKKDVKTLDQLEQELPNLRGTARTTAETHIKDLSKNVLDLTNTMAENNKEVQQLTKATVSNTTATGQMTGSVGFSYQNQDYVAAGSQSSERLVNVNLG